MEPKRFVLINKGMNRDLSVSKAGESSAYENYNVRITARDGDTLLSVTNERGNREVPLSGSISGTLIGWNVLNGHIILFTHSEDEENPDSIYRIDYDAAEDTFSFAGNKGPDGIRLYCGNLNFDLESPIESVVHFETDMIQKIYWTDGRNVLRFMNFMEPENDSDVYASWDDTIFDSNRYAEFGVRVSITKDCSGNSRPNGVVQYLLTYFNLHGQETGYVWMSDLVYLSPEDRGGAADGTNTNSIMLEISGLDTRFTNFRIYSVFRSSLDGQTTAYLVAEHKTTADTMRVIDDGAHLILQDATRLLYLGSQAVVSGTLSHKDQTLFLGDLKSTGRRGYDELETLIRNEMFGVKKEDGSIKQCDFEDGKTYLSARIRFEYSDSPELGGEDDTGSIPLPELEGTYAYYSQLKLTSSAITTFKGGEKYRFALKFKCADGTETDAFWIGDAINDKYPIMDSAGCKVRRAIAVCTLPSKLVRWLKESPDDYRTVRLLIAEATYADRSVKAQGIVSPTMFNVWERYSGRTYAMPSWITRVRHAGFAWRHFQPVDKSTMTTGEISCNWWSDGDMKPYYIDGDTYEGFDSYGTFCFIYRMNRSLKATISLEVFRFMLEYRSGDYNAVMRYKISESQWNSLCPWPVRKDSSQNNYATPFTGKEYVRSLDINDPGQGGIGGMDFSLKCEYIGVVHVNKSNENNRINTLHSKLGQLFTDCYISNDLLPSAEFLHDVYNAVPSGKKERTFVALLDNQYLSAKGYETFNNAAERKWTSSNGEVSSNPYSSEKGFMPSLSKRHIMFVDENVVTLDSPELAYGMLSLDNASYRFRIVGVAKQFAVMTDYTIDATKSHVAGADYDMDNFSGNIYSLKDNTGEIHIDGITAWPLWKEFYMTQTQDSIDTEKDYKEESLKKKEELRTTQDFKLTTPIVKYWLYLWNHTGVITCYAADEEGNAQEESTLKGKTFANLRYFSDTVFLKEPYEYASAGSLRQTNDLTSNDLFIKIGSDIRQYSPTPRLSLSVPGSVVYPVTWTAASVDDTSKDYAADSEDNGKYRLYTSMPVQIEFRTGGHAVISLPTVDGPSYTQYLLPVLETGGGDDDERCQVPQGCILPWLQKVKPYAVSQPIIGNCSTEGKQIVDRGERYVFIGEIYRDYGDGESDTRYGGIHLSAVETNRFASAGPQYVIEDMEGDGTDEIYGNQGDTWFQRWDALRTRPYSDGAVNRNIEIASVMVETHINLDGRTDTQRGIHELASIDTTSFGQVNEVYSQYDNFVIRRDLDEDFNTDSFRSSLTWTLPKEDMAVTDEWTHITLAGMLKLDGDKGICRALRRVQNSLIAFQDKGVAEVLYNSRTQLATNDGVPVEIANSGRVDGKNYITNRYGCVNKWSIVEGKNALYFIDSLNKAFCAIGGQGGFDDISQRLGFSYWFRKNVSVRPWTPGHDAESVISFYDKVHSDVYLVKTDATDQPCLVYNERLGAFTSFLGYGDVWMMTNVEDRFVSFKDGRLWLQNEGLYCSFFGKQDDFYVQYRVTPEPFGDKIWTNVDMRADFHKTLDEDGSPVTGKDEDLTDLDEWQYDDKEHFDTIRVWNEYQDTGESTAHPVKKFRIWRYDIPRALPTSTNIFGLDRIRNPWVNLMFRKRYDDDGDSNRNMMQLHDIIIGYFE